MVLVPPSFKKRSVLNEIPCKKKFKWELVSDLTEIPNEINHQTKPFARKLTPPNLLLETLSHQTSTALSAPHACAIGKVRP